MVTTLLGNPPDMEAFAHSRNKVGIIALRGSYDIARRVGLLTELDAIAGCDIAIIDMREVARLDATALACFIQLRKRLRQGGPGIVRIVGLRSTLYRVFEIANLHHVFEVFETISDAMGEYGYTVNESVNR